MRKPWDIAALGTVLAVLACGGPESAGQTEAASADLTAASTNAWIYRDALVSPWVDYSWATHNLANTRPVAAGTRSISVALGPWQGLYFNRSAIATAGYSALVLQVNGAASGAGATVRVRAVLSGGSWTSGVDLGPTCTGGAIPAGRWATCRIPMSSLAPAGASVTGIALQEWSGKTLPTLYFDEIGLESNAQAVAVAISPTTASVAVGRTAQFSATVSGSSNSAVTWSIQEGAAGGTISGAGLYTAPSAAGTYHVVATSQADATKSATATVVVTALAPPPPTTCLGSDLLTSLGKRNVLVGFSGGDAVATQASWDLRYQYLAGPIADPSSSCSSASGSWWGCWQDWSQPPGQFVTGFMGTAGANHQIAMFTYYIVLPASGAAEGAGEVAAANDASFMARYLADWRFLLGRIGTSTALLHIEPDFWAYAQHVNSNPHLVPAAVASANATDCAGYENSIAGLGQCMIRMVRKYAPNAKVGLHASGWASGIDVTYNTNPSLDVAGEAAKVAGFLNGCGAANTDFVVVEMSDRDAGYYQSTGRNAWWDATNATLPSFHQALAWSKAIAEAVGKPLLWWQIPVGDMNQNNTANHWKDNRVQYFFDHPAEFAQAHGAGIAFGAGAGDQTTPTTDGGYLVGRATTYLSAGGTPLCP